MNYRQARESDEEVEEKIRRRRLGSRVERFTNGGSEVLGSIMF